MKKKDLIISCICVIISLVSGIISNDIIVGGIILLTGLLCAYFASEGKRINYILGLINYLLMGYVVNAMCHNDWSKEYAPKFEVFSDRLVISSNGGIQEGVTRNEFLQGFSLPKNKELMKVFRDLELVEQMGTGIIRILESYDESSFEFFPNFIRVSFPFNENKFSKSNKQNKIKSENNKLSEIQSSIISLMSDSSTITQATLANLLDVNIRTIQRNIKDLMDLDIVERIGATKKGEWKVNNKES